MMKDLIDRALHQETALERVREKARLAGEELLELKSWKPQDRSGGQGERAPSSQREGRPRVS